MTADDMALPNDVVSRTRQMGIPVVMATPPEVTELLDTLAEDIYDAYDNPRLYPAPEKGGAVTAARYLARKLIRKGWRKGGDLTLPRCPYGTVTCYDPRRTPTVNCDGTARREARRARTRRRLRPTSAGASTADPDSTPCCRSARCRPGRRW